MAVTDLERTVQTLTHEDFATLFGLPVEQIPPECYARIAEGNFRYRVLGAEARDEVILGILKSLEADLAFAGKDRLGRWEEGWNENLEAFIASNYDPTQLIPGYYRKTTQPIMRLRGEYVLPEDPAFETHFLAVLIAWVGMRFLRDVRHIYEFGCGPAHNLVALARLFPDKRLHGLDWAKASQHIITALAERHGFNISGHHFDMFAPDPAFRLEPYAAVLTLGALEQLGTEYEAFLRYVLDQSPAVCVHIEPIYELYDQSRLFDYLAARYSERRGYLRGYLPRLKELEAEAVLEILHVQKNLGSLYHDGWTTVAWRPSRLAGAR